MWLESGRKVKRRPNFPSWSWSGWVWESSLKGYFSFWYSTNSFIADIRKVLHLQPRCRFISSHDEQQDPLNAGRGYGKVGDIFEIETWHYDVPFEQRQLIELYGDWTNELEQNIRMIVLLSLTPNFVVVPVVMTLADESEWQAQRVGNPCQVDQESISCIPMTKSWVRML